MHITFKGGERTRCYYLETLLRVEPNITNNREFYDAIVHLNTLNYLGSVFKEDLGAETAQKFTSVVKEYYNNIDRAALVFVTDELQYSSWKNILLNKLGLVMMMLLWSIN